MLIFALALVASDPLAQPFATLAHTDAELAQCKTNSTPRCRFLVVDADWRAAHDPPALANNAEGLHIFHSELENIAFPVVAKAVDELKTAKLAAEKDVDSPYPQRCNAQLAALER